MIEWLSEYGAITNQNGLDHINEQLLTQLDRNSKSLCSRNSPNLI